jgi:hypothetical protein
MSKAPDLLHHIIEIKEAIARLDGIVNRVAQVEKDVAETRTTLKTLWAVVISLPLIGGVLAYAKTAITTTATHMVP